MPYEPDRHHRRSIRLAGYGYFQAGAYFVTLCTHDRVCVFGEVADGDVRLNDCGVVAERCWRAIPDHFPHVKLDAFVIMPNHVHGILWIVDANGADAQYVVGANNHSPLHRPQDNSTGLHHDVGANNHSPLQRPQDNSTGLHRVVGANNHSPLQHPPQSPLRLCGTSKTIGSVVRGFKIGVTTWMRNNHIDGPIWQRNYYEHIIRDDASLDRIREYIVNNPVQWALDRENPEFEEAHRHGALPKEDP